MERYSLKGLFKKLLNNYGIIGLVMFGTKYLISKILYPKQKFIRGRLDLRGRRFFELGKGMNIGVGCRIQAERINDKPILKFGKNVELNDYCHIACVSNIQIGNNVLIASRVFITDHNHGNYSGPYHSHIDCPPNLRKIYSKPVVIEDNVWIGEGVSILPGVSIGYGSIVGANSVVTKSLPRGVIAAGSPARIVKHWSEKDKKWI